MGSRTVERDDGIVGRARELDALAGWLDAAGNGAGRLVLCSGEPGIGKTRLAQEFAGLALAAGTAVAWGRCVEAEGAPPYWPWRQVFRSLMLDPDAVLSGDIDTSEDRFRLLDQAAVAVMGAAAGRGLVVILDDVHWADEASLLVLRHVADQLQDARLLVHATYREIEPESPLTPMLPELLRSPVVERLHLQGLTLDEVREQLARTAGGEERHAQAVLDVTGGNPLFVREVARTMADGTWRADRPPRTVLDVVGARIARISAECRRFVQAAAVVGRDFPLAVVAAALDEPIERILPAVDEAIARGLIDRVGAGGSYRFVHALTRQAVEASLSTAEQIALHRAVANAIEAHFAADLSEHLADLARHWAALAPYGEAAIARRWTTRAAEDAVLRLAYEEGLRLYQAALAFPAAGLDDIEHCRLLIAAGRAAYLAGDLPSCVELAVVAGNAARATGTPELLAEAALVLEAVPDPQTNAVTIQLCEEALAALGDTGAEAPRARLLAQRSHLAFYDGEQERVESLSAAALGLAREAADDRALIAALHARKEACPGATGRAEREALAAQMIELGRRTGNARATMWGELWRIDTLLENGRVGAAAEELAKLQVAVERVGGPVSDWHLEKVRACIAQAQGRYADAADAGRRAFERMRPIEPGPATGAYFALRAALARHVGASAETTAFVRQVSPLPRFRTVAPLTQAFTLLRAGLRGEAEVAYREAGPIETWALPAFFVAPVYIFALLTAVELDARDDVVALMERMTPLRGEHAISEGVSSMGPVDLALGQGAALLGRLDDAVEELDRAAGIAERAGCPGFIAEARYHLASALLARGGPGDRDRAAGEAQAADALARALGMTAYIGRTEALVGQLAGDEAGGLSKREAEVARLVGEGLTNRQIAERLVISERTAQNHVQHILTKLGFSTRSQIAAWTVRTTNE